MAAITKFWCKYVDFCLNMGIEKRSDQHAGRTVEVPKSIKFKGNTYETSDPEEIAALRAAMKRQPAALFEQDSRDEETLQRILEAQEVTVGKKPKGAKEATPTKQKKGLIGAFQAD